MAKKLGLIMAGIVLIIVFTGFIGLGERKTIATTLIINHINMTVNTSSLINYYTKTETDNKFMINNSDGDYYVYASAINLNGNDITSWDEVNGTASATAESVFQIKVINGNVVMSFGT